MKLQNICYVSLIVIVSFVSAKVVNRPRFSNYHLPWACSVVHSGGDLVGSCAIFDEDKVIVSVDNFNEEVSVKGKTMKFYQEVKNILVYAGSNLMDPERLKPWATPEYQVGKAVSLHISTGRTGRKWQVRATPNITDLSRDSVEYDHYGSAFNVGFLSVETPFKFNNYVQPILIRKDLTKKTEFYMKDRDDVKALPSDTCVTYSWTKPYNRIRYHEVTYLAKSNCLDLFCSWNLSTCEMFPKQPYHACFKSVTYADVCPSARGAALYCPDFAKTTFGILTTAPSCGVRHMPGVYTTLPLVLELYEAIFGKKVDTDKRPKYDPLRLQQPYSPFG